jgi:hypothetical protein
MNVRGIRFVLPLATLAGVLFFAPPVFPADQSGSKPPPKNTKAEQPISKKESRMKQRDREMDQRMKQKKTR